MGRHDDHPTFVAQPLEEPDDRLGLDVVEVGRRLVGEQQRRVVPEPAGDRDPLLLAAGQATRQMLPAVAEVDLFQQFVGPGEGILAVHAGEGAAARRCSRERSATR